MIIWITARKEKLQNIERIEIECFIKRQIFKFYKDADVIKALLHDVYETFYPFPSQFELESQYRNRFQYLQDYRSWKAKKLKLLYLVQFFIVILICSFACPNIFSKLYKKFSRKVF